MQLFRMIPPTSGANVITAKGGRGYTATAGGTIDVPDFDAEVLEANGWIRAARLGVGSTAQRPTGLTQSDRGKDYLDTTIGYNILWTGSAWRVPLTGAAA